MEETVDSLLAEIEAVYQKTDQTSAEAITNNLIKQLQISSQLNKG